MLRSEDDALETREKRKSLETNLVHQVWSGWPSAANVLKTFKEDNSETWLLKDISGTPINAPRLKQKS